MFSPPAHRFDVGTEVRDIHVRPSLQLGDSRLVYVQGFTERFLGHRPRLPQLVQRHATSP